MPASMVDKWTAVPSAHLSTMPTTTTTSTAQQEKGGARLQ